MHCHKLPKGYEEEVKEQDTRAKKRVSFVETLEENKSRCTAQEINQAKEARKFYHNIGAPTLENVKHSMKGNSVRNNPVTEQDMIMAEDVFGKDPSYLKGKTTKRTPKAVIDDTIAVPRESRATEKMSCCTLMPLVSMGCHFLHRLVI